GHGRSIVSLLPDCKPCGLLPLLWLLWLRLGRERTTLRIRLWWICLGRGRRIHVRSRQRVLIRDRRALRDASIESLVLLALMQAGNVVISDHSRTIAGALLLGVR